jgi:hypothetical protein
MRSRGANGPVVGHQAGAEAGERTGTALLNRKNTTHYPYTASKYFHNLRCPVCRAPGYDDIRGGRFGDSPQRCGRCLQRSPRWAWRSAA